jgi:DNA-binding SARP family transcriptional activator
MWHATGAPMIIRIAVLGGFTITCDDRPVALSTGAQRLLAFLAIHDRPLPRAYISENLWIESSQLRSHANLRSALWRVRQSGLSLLAARGDSLALDPQVRVDFKHAVALARSALAGETAMQFEWEELVKDLLPDSYEDWVLLEREHFRQLRLHALEKLCEMFTNQRLFPQAVEIGISAVIGEPLRESAQSVLIRAYLAEGNRGEAISQYCSYRQLLMRELQLEPSPELQELMQPLSASVAAVSLRRAAAATAGGASS